ncbi:MAG: transposase [Sedimentisphaerales bacterium]|nr:transposase [Sedimentisphaerales bacterium]
MKQMLGYMLTWTTYGSWLQGDDRGYVKDGRVFGADERLRKVNEEVMIQEQVVLGQEEREIVRRAITEAVGGLNQELYAIAVKGTHLHLVLGWVDKEIGRVVQRYKSAGAWALKEQGWKGKVWTKGYDKRFCFDDKELKVRIEYVRGHER